MAKKYKILALGDHPLSWSGVGTQNFYLLNGLVNTGKYSIKSLGAAVKHANYDLTIVNDDFIIKPIDGFGTPEIIRQILATEEIDCILLFSDPRFYAWLFETHDEIHACDVPIVYNTLWDNKPSPKYNRWMYDSCDFLSCISKLSYEMTKEVCSDPEKVDYNPHFLPEDKFFPISEEEKVNFKKQLLGKDRLEHFVGLFVSRNARRKRCADLLWTWKIFLEKLENKYGHKNTTLILKTDAIDAEGTDLFAVAEHLGVIDNIFFAKDYLQLEQMNILHNISDFNILSSHSEGFGLSVLTSLYCGVPCVAPKTGGITDQILDPETGEEFGIACNIDLQTIVGSPSIPYIYEEYASVHTMSDCILKLYDYGPEKRKKLGQNGRKYVLKNFNEKDVISKWDRNIENTIKNWKQKRKLWTIKEL